MPTSAPGRPTRELTERELFVLLKVASSWSNKEIAEELEVNPVTVTNTLHRIYVQLDVQDRIGAVVRAFERGIFKVPGCNCKGDSTTDEVIAEPRALEHAGA